MLGMDRAQNKMSTPRATEIARAILESYAAPYFATQPTQFVARQKVIAEAAKAVEPMIREIECAVARTIAANPS